MTFLLLTWQKYNLAILLTAKLGCFGHYQGFLPYGIFQKVQMRLGNLMQVQNYEKISRWIPSKVKKNEKQYFSAKVMKIKNTVRLDKLPECCKRSQLRQQQRTNPSRTFHNVFPPRGAHKHPNEKTCTHPHTHMHTHTHTHTHSHSHP